MNAAGDYSSAYCILETDSQFSGHGMVSAYIYSLRKTGPSLTWVDVYYRPRKRHCLLRNFSLG